MSRLRVALVGLYPAEGIVTGGAEKVCQQLAQALADRPDAEVHVVCHASRALDRMDGLVHVHAVPRSRWVPGGVDQYLGMGVRLRRAVRRVAPDIVHSHVVVYGMHMSGLGIPSVTTVHGVYFREAALATGALRLGALVHVPMFRRALARLRFIICISPHVAEELRPHTKAVFFHVPNPVDPAFFALNAEAAREDRVLYVGHLRPEKGTVPLVAAFERVRRTHPHAQLRLVGKPLSEAYAREIDATVRRLGLQDAVVRTGPLGPDSGLLAEFERARVLALPSLQEVLPMVIAEAMAAGLPVVATDVGGVATMVEEGRTGLLAPCGDFGAFAAHLERLMADPALCRQMGRRGRDKAMDVYHPARVAEQTMAVYEKVLNARQGAPEAGRRGDA